MGLSRGSINLELDEVVDGGRRSQQGAVFDTNPVTKGIVQIPKRTQRLRSFLARAMGDSVSDRSESADFLPEHGTLQIVHRASRALGLLAIETPLMGVLSVIVGFPWELVSGWGESVCSAFGR